ncbi:MAG: hypothetical protein LZF64_05605 [Nitrosomonas sp.]|uniref:hypothetical protein n=1 Tax=Nitrosomonas sp. TaxID=42353 RepID=UPI001A470D97|nr:hypothetical protein [Nitrosomonas sp.]MBL8499970.1 hypothetical protein [Nitrosomonas sp.]MCG7755265.1 hypothetical protein [Nitrosomonas sp.]UJP01244.1 MAG: hypothetical protein LZF64_05605 [Nitrosomonas sp.]UJP01923.1 MAG: hypothetical protein LZF85_09010 [Nitrosomonas sp.]UJP08552.1 MAG: hypothetical protein LZF84_05485 [Nitrosomonas sp.]
MGLSDWLTSLFSSKNDEENKTNENNIESDDDKDQAGSDSTLQDVSEIKPESVESEIQASSETDVLHNNDEPQEASLK